MIQCARMYNVQCGLRQSRLKKIIDELAGVSGMTSNLAPQEWSIHVSVVVELMRNEFGRRFISYGTPVEYIDRLRMGKITLYHTCPPYH